MHARMSYAATLSVCPCRAAPSGSGVHAQPRRGARRHAAPGPAARAAAPGEKRGRPHRQPAVRPRLPQRYRHLAARAPGQASADARAQGAAAAHGRRADLPHEGREDGGHARDAALRQLHLGARHSARAATHAHTHTRTRAFMHTFLHAGVHCAQRSPRSSVPQEAHARRRARRPGHVPANPPSALHNTPHPFPARRSPGEHPQLRRHFERRHLQGLAKGRAFARTWRARTFPVTSPSSDGNRHILYESQVAPG